MLEENNGLIILKKIFKNIFFAKFYFYLKSTSNLYTYCSFGKKHSFVRGDKIDGEKLVTYVDGKI